MKQKPRWTLEMLTASLAVLCGLLVLVLLVQRPTAWPAEHTTAAKERQPDHRSPADGQSQTT